MKLIRRPKGMNDILPETIEKWYYLEDQFRKICTEYAYSEIRTPILEYTNLFVRGIGETTDVVQKEMFNIEQKTVDGNKRDEILTLKPEGTAAVIRAYLENSLYSNSQPTKLFYNTPCFRYEKPQKGRLREFHQFGVEVLSSKSPYTDAEVIALVYDFFVRVGVSEHIRLNINSIGTFESRKEYQEQLKNYFFPHYESLCADCKERFEKNPMRLLDCKVESCKKIAVNAPLITDFLDTESKAHFEELKEYLSIMNIPFTVDPYIVRGLDYYVNTAFEFTTDKLGSQATVCGGGRYDGLVEQLGGNPTPGIGFGLGIERLILLMDAVNVDFPKHNPLQLFIVALGRDAKGKAARIISSLRQSGISAELDHIDRSMKAQMKYADKMNARYTAIIGESELLENKILLKNMSTSEQNEMKLSDFIETFRRIIEDGAVGGE